MGTTAPGVMPPTGCNGVVTAGMAGAESSGGAAGLEEPGGVYDGVGWAAAGAPAPCLAMNASMSSLVMRPPRPVPGTLARSTLFSFAMRRTSGLERTRSGSPPSLNSSTLPCCWRSRPSFSSRARSAGIPCIIFGSSPLEGCAACVWVAPAPSPPAAAFGGCGAGAAGAALAASPSPAIVPTTVLTWTVVPACTLMSCKVPEAGAGISASTLSVEISNSGSSRWTFSPGCFSHLVMVPSKIDSPIWGMMTSVGISSSRGVNSCNQALLENPQLYRGKTTHR